MYAPGERAARLRRVMRAEYGVRDRVRFDTRITAATFDEAHGLWRARDEPGRDAHRASCDRRDRRPHPAEAARHRRRRERSPASAMHTARWDPDQRSARQADCRDRHRRLGCAGDPRDRSGRAGADRLPAHADLVPAEARRPPVPADARGAAPACRAPRLPRGCSARALVELTFPIAAHYHRTFPLADDRSKSRHAHTCASRFRIPSCASEADAEVCDGMQAPELSQRVPRDLQPRQRRARHRPDRADHAQAACVTAGGVEHEVDVLVLATGFKVFDPGNFPKYPVAGRDGVDLEQWWDEHRYQAYEGVSVPGFPNYFAMFGPYGYNGSSYFNLIETQSRHIVRCLRHARTSARPRLRSGPRRTSVTSARCCAAAAARCSGSRAARSRTATTSIRTVMCRCGRARRSRRCGAAAASRCTTTASSGREALTAALPGRMLASAATS